MIQINSHTDVIVIIGILIIFTFFAMGFIIPCFTSPSTIYKAEVGNYWKPIYFNDYSIEECSLIIPEYYEAGFYKWDRSNNVVFSTYRNIERIIK